jgi:long-subunit acyl-CoA synthetase (AMP-forming)
LKDSSPESLAEAAVRRLERLANLRRELKQKKKYIAEIQAEMLEARMDLAEIEQLVRGNLLHFPFPVELIAKETRLLRRRAAG